MEPIVENSAKPPTGTGKRVRRNKAELVVEHAKCAHFCEPTGQAGSHSG